MKANKGISSVAAFLKKNIYYVLLFICIAAIAAMIIVAVVLNNGEPTLPNDGNNNNNQTEQPPEDEVPTIKPMVFSLPVRQGRVGMDYSATEFVWLNTQLRYQIHNGIDFIAPEGTNVYAAFDGTVRSVYTNILEGTVVIISHQDGVETIYKSLDNVRVRVGDTVKTNDIIGYVSDSMMYEVAMGPHLHFEVTKAGKTIAPSTYLPSLEK